MGKVKYPLVDMVRENLDYEIEVSLCDGDGFCAEFKIPTTITKKLNAKQFGSYFGLAEATEQALLPEHWSALAEANPDVFSYNDEEKVLTVHFGNDDAEMGTCDTRFGLELVEGENPVEEADTLLETVVGISLV